MFLFFQERSVVRVSIPPEYSPLFTSFDICILELQDPWDLSEYEAHFESAISISKCPLI